MAKKPTLKKDIRPKPQDTTASIASAIAVPGQKNPYGASPGGGITLPPYYKPTPSMINANDFFPLSETLAPDEMRITFAGTCPFPPKRNQAATCIMGDRSLVPVRGWRCPDP